MISRRTLAIVAFSILGLLAAVCSILNFRVGTTVAFAIMGTTALILLANLLSQVRAEGATHRKNLTALRKRIGESTDEITTEVRIASQQLQARAAKNKDLLKKQLVSNGEAVSRLNDAMVGQFETWRNELAAIFQEDGAQTRSTVETLHEAHSVAVRNMAAWLDTLRDVVESTDDQLEGVTTGVTGVRESLNSVASSLLQIQSEFAERSSAMEDHITALEGSHLTLSRDQKQHLDAVKVLINRNFTETVSRSERLSASVEAMRNGIAESRSSAIDSVSAAREAIVNSVESQQKHSDAIVAENLNDIQQVITNADLGTSERLAELSETLKAFFVEEHAKSAGRISAALDGARQDAADSALPSEEEIREEISTGFETIRSQQSKQTNKLNIAMYSETQQVEALLQLLPTLTPRWLMPSLGRWAIDARAMLHLRQIIQDQQPRQILELGSGTSTIWLGYIAEQIGASVTSIDHDEKFKQRTDYFLGKHRLNDVVSTVHAPLSPLRLDDTDYHWYDLQAFEGLQDIDLLVIDGPVGTTNRWARYPALPVLWSQLAEDALVVLDDASRQEESESVESWLNDFDITTIQQGASGLAVLKRDARNKR